MIRICRHICILIAAVATMTTACSGGESHQEKVLSATDSMLSIADFMVYQGQTSQAIDLQYRAIEKAEDRSQRIKANIRLAYSLYLSEDYRKAKRIAEESLCYIDSVKTIDPTLTKHKADARMLYADILMETGSDKEAIRQYTIAARNAASIKDEDCYIKCMKIVLNEEYEHGNFGSAIDGFRELLNHCDKDDASAKFDIYYRLQRIFLSIGNINEAAKNLESMRRLVKPEDTLSKFILNVAEARQAYNDYDESGLAQSIYKLQKDLENKNIEQYYEYNAHGLIAEYYLLNSQYDSAQYYIDRLCLLSQNNRKPLLPTYAKLTLAKSLIFQNKFGDAKNILLDNKIKSACDRDIELREIYFKVLSDFYFKTGNYEQSYKHIKRASEITDSINTEALSHNLSYRDMAHQRDTTILTNNIRISKQQNRIEELVFWQWAGAILLFMSLISIFIIVLRIGLGSIKNREKEIYQQNLVLQHEVVRHTSVLQSQKIELERTNEKLNKEIEYASRIQNDILPSESKLTSSLISSHMLFYRPCAHISGDFYWFNKIGSKLLVCCGDATGHGIPGAFVAMVCSTMLNDITARQENITAASLMKAVDENMRNILLNNISSHGNDSVDMSIICVDEETKETTIALARHNAYLLHKNGEIEQIQGVKRSIGDLDEAFIAREFTQQSIETSSDDMLIVTTDGLESQFGGDNCKKLKRQRMTEMFKGLYNQPDDEKHGYISQFFTKWKGDNEQTDDVLVISLKFK